QQGGDPAKVLLRAPPEKISLHALHHERSLLIVHARCEREHACRALRLELADDEARVERVPDIHGLQEAGGLIEEADQRILDKEREEAGPCGRLDQDLIAVREKIGMP